MQQPHAFQVCTHRLHQLLGQHRDAVFLPLALANQDLAVREVVILAAKPQALQHAKAGPIEKARDEAARAGELLDQARAALGQAPTEELQALRVEEFLARFRQTADASRCPSCGAQLYFVSLIAHGPAPPPLLH